mgnify:CR=1 FL=1
MIADLFDSAQTLLFEGFVQPLVFWLGLGNLLEDAYAATGWLLLGLLQVGLRAQQLPRAGMRHGCGPGPR